MEFEYVISAIVAFERKEIVLLKLNVLFIEFIMCSLIKFFKIIFLVTMPYCCQIIRVPNGKVK